MRISLLSVFALLVSVIGASGFILAPASTAANSDPCFAEGTILGTFNDDLLIGTPGSDVIKGRGGDDVIRGRGGKDVICGGNGADHLRGGAGEDELRGGHGVDSANGGDGIDDCRAESQTNCEEPEPEPSISPTQQTPSQSTTPSPTGTPPSGGAGGGPTNNPPTDISLSNAALPENQPSGTAVGTLSATDLDGGQTHAFSLVSGTGSTDNASFAIAGNQLQTNAVLDFEDQPTYSIRVRATDNGSPVMTLEKVFTITVTDAQESPAVATSGGNTSYTEGGAPVTVDGSLTVSDADDTDLEGATISVTSPQAGDQLLFVDQGGITGSGSGTSTLTLAGTASLATYQSALRTIQFLSTSDNPAASKTISFVVTDGDAASSPAPKTVAVTGIDDPPNAIDDSATTTEDSSSGSVDVLGNDTDPDGGPMTISSASDPANGTVVLTGGSPGAHTGLTYQPDPAYCNSPGVFLLDTFTYTLNGGDTATVSMTVTCDNDPGTAVDDSTTVAEDSGATPIDVLANDTDADGGSSIASKTNGTNGTVAITNTGADLTYTPNANYCNSPPALLLDTFTYTLNGGSTATVTVTVTCVDDDPVAVDDSKTVNEDSGATTIDVLANDTDVDGGSKTVQSKTDGTNGMVAITNAGADLTYSPAADFCGSDSFTYTLNGGDSGTVNITVDCLNDAPVITAAASTSALIDVAKVISGVSVSDVDAGADDVELTLGVDDGTLTFSETVTNGLVAGDITGNGTDAVVVSASMTKINNTLADAAGLTYLNDATFAGTSDTLSLDLDDLGKNGGGGAQTATDSMSINFNAPPASDTATVTTNEDTEKTITLTATDPDGDPVTFKITSLPANGDLHEGTTSAGTLITSVPHVLPADKVTYVPDPNGNGTSYDSFKFTASDGSDGNEATITIDVTAVDDSPVAVDDSKTVIEDASAAAINVLSNDTDVDGGAKTIMAKTDGTNGTVAITNAGADLTYTPNANYCNTPPGTTLDTFTYDLNGGDSATVTVTVTCVDDPPIVTNDSKTVAEDSGATTIDVLANDSDVDGGTKTITAKTDGTNGTVAITNAGADLTYTPNANYCNAPPGTTLDTFTYQVNGADSATVTVTVTCVDDAPVAVNDTTTLVEDASATAVPVLTNDTDVDGGPKTISSASDPANGTVVLTGGSPGAHTGLTYQPDANYCNDPPGTTPDTFTYTLNGGSNATVSVTVTCVNDAPVADTDAYTGGIQGTRLRVGTTHADTNEVEVSGNVLQGDTDIDTPLASLTVTAGTITSAGCLSASPACSNNIQMASDGTFTYDPPAGHSGDDTFSYQVNDNDTGDTGSPAQSDTETVTLTLVGPRTWYIDDSAPAGGRGVSHAPLQSLPQLATGGNLNEEDGSNDRIFVYSGTYSTGIDLESGQKLLGEPNGLNVNGTQLVAAGGTKPAISSATGHVVQLHSGTNEVQDVALGSSPAGSYSLLAPSGVGAFTVADTDINNGTGGALNILDGTPSVVLGTLSSTGSSNNGVRIADTEAGGTVSSTGGTLSNATGATFFMNNAHTTVNLGSAISDDLGQLVSVTGGSSAVTYNGTVTDLEDGDGDGIAITGTSGAHNFTKSVRLSTGNSAAFSMTSSPSGSLRMVPTVDSNRVTTTGGAALTVTDTPIHANGLQFEKISAQDGSIEAATYGIHLSNTGAGSLTVTGTGVADSGGIITGKATGIKLNNATGPSLTRMKLSNHGDFAIKGDTVTNFTMANTVIDGSIGRNGNDASADEGAVSFDELFGSATISNSTIKEGWENELRIKNDSGTLNRLTVTATTFGSTGVEHNDAIQLEANLTATLNATIQTSTFTGTRGDQIQATIQDNGAGDVQVLNNTVTNNHPSSVGGGILVAAAGSGDMTYAINNNSINGALGSALVAEKLFGSAGGSDGTLVGTISGNTVGTSGVAASGSANGSGIFIRQLARGKHSVQITNNTIRQYRDHGMAIFAGGAPQSATLVTHDGDLNLTLTGNNVAQPQGLGAGTGGGIYVQAGTNSPDAYDVCLNATNNTVNGSAPNASGSTDFLLFQRFDTKINLPGYTGPADDTSGTLDPALDAYFAPRFVNNATTTKFYLVNTASATGGYFNTTGGAPCPTT